MNEEYRVTWTVYPATVGDIKEVEATCPDGVGWRHVSTIASHSDCRLIHTWVRDVTLGKQFDVCDSFSHEIVFSVGPEEDLGNKILELVKERDDLYQRVTAQGSVVERLTKDRERARRELFRARGVIEKIQAHIEAGPADVELTAATVLCSDLLEHLQSIAEGHKSAPPIEPPTQEPSDGEVEAMAEGLYDTVARSRGLLTPWSETEETFKRHQREAARYALCLQQEAVTHAREQTKVDCDNIVRRLHEILGTPDGGYIEAQAHEVIRERDEVLVDLRNVVAQRDVLERERDNLKAKLRKISDLTIIPGRVNAEREAVTAVEGLVRDFCVVVAHRDATRGKLLAERDECMNLLAKAGIEGYETLALAIKALIDDANERERDREDGLDEFEECQKSLALAREVLDKISSSIGTGASCDGCLEEVGETILRGVESLKTHQDTDVDADLVFHKEAIRSIRNILGLPDTRAVVVFNHVADTVAAVKRVVDAKESLRGKLTRANDRRGYLRDAIREITDGLTSALGVISRVEAGE